ncbi:hypothetical protein [Chondrinema litorale]|uniref:hypothetical protein n=1 Tax=Chondrinema litorale TaxID=2994555 RepID=UPI002543B691|nr:hypothetical protein [Chondrinema litorale]UZS00199.1 hypothetical protein OQ292_40475 [Chondrinema litorale]
MSENTSQSDSSKKWLEITTDDYEAILANKVIGKAYKLVKGLVISISAIIGIILLVFGVSYNNQLKEYSTKMKKANTTIDSLAQKYKESLTDIELANRAREMEDTILSDYYGRINDSYLGYTSTLFRNYNNSVYDNLRKLSQIEDDVKKQTTVAFDSINLLSTKILNISQEIGDAKEEIEDARIDIANLIRPDTLEEYRDKIITTLQQIENVSEEVKKKRVEVHDISKNQTEFSYLLNDFITYENKPLKKEKIILLKKTFTKETGLPTNLTVGNNTLKLNWNGNIGDKKIKLKISY